MARRLWAVPHVHEFRVYMELKLTALGWFAMMKVLSKGKRPITDNPILAYLYAILPNLYNSAIHESTC